MEMSKKRVQILPAALVVLLLIWSVATTTSASSSLPILNSFAPLVPAFAWSNHRKLVDSSNLPTAIDYQTLSSKDFVAKVKNLFLGQQRHYGEHDGPPVERDDSDLDVVVVFVGTKLRSGDVARAAETVKESSTYILQVLNRVVTPSNSSLSLPYVAIPRDGAGVADALVKAIVGGASEDGEIRLGQVMTTESCVEIKHTPQTKRLSLSGLLEFLGTRMLSTGPVGKTDLVVVCGSSELEMSRGGSMALSEGETLDEVLWGLDDSSARYAALYITDLSGEKALPGRPRGRQLGSVVYEGEEYCNEVCQTKATILEGLVVGLALLIILISGLCCMGGITTPSRFEQNREGQ